MKGTQYVARQPDESGFIHYSDSEHQVWNTLITRQMKVLEGRACQEYFDGIEQLAVFCHFLQPQGNAEAMIRMSQNYQCLGMCGAIFFQVAHRL